MPHLLKMRILFAFGLEDNAGSIFRRQSRAIIYECNIIAFKERSVFPRILAMEYNCFPTVTQRKIEFSTNSNC